MSENNKVDSTIILSGETSVDIITLEDFYEKYKNHHRFEFMKKQFENITICKADMFSDCIVGTMSVPDKKLPRIKRATFGFILTKNALVFVDNSNIVEKIFEKLLDIGILDKLNASQILFDFFEYTISQSVSVLHEYNQHIELLEDIVANEKFNDKKDNTSIEQEFLVTKRKLSIFKSYYQQMIDMGSHFEECADMDFLKDNCNRFSFFIRRIDRYYDMATDLKEYVNQVNDMYESKINTRQNSIMKTLTVITSIFMPLTLIVGWYGMNFVAMPELNWNLGYIVVIAVCVIITIGELLYFKYKKWF